MASGIIKGSCQGGSGSSYNFWLEWTSISNEAENYSLLTATAYLQRNDGNSNSAYNLYFPKENKYISIDGEKFYASEKGVDTRNLKKVVIAKITSKRIDHDQDGTKKLELSAGFFDLNTISLDSGFLSKTVYLDALQREPANFVKSPTVEFVDQNSVTIDFSLDSEVSAMAYYLSGQPARQYFSEVPLVINDLNPNQKYTVSILVWRKDNGVLTVGDPVAFQTEPIRIESLEIPSQITLSVGDSISLPYTVEPKNASIKKLELTSSNPDAVSVDGLTLTAKSKGYSVITAKTIDGSEIVREIRVDSVVKVSGIYANPSDIMIAKNSTVKMYFSIMPSDASNKNYTIESSDPSIVSVSGLDVTGISEGAATITATTENGEFKAVCNIEVVGKYVWYDYSEPLEVLNSEDVNHIYSNMQTIQSLLLENGYNVNLIDTTTEKSISLSKMLELLQNIEYNLDRLNDTGFRSIHYVQPKTVGSKASNYNDIWRWLQILNEMYLMLNGTFGKWEYVLLDDGYPTIDGKRLLIRGDTIG